MGACNSSVGQNLEKRCAGQLKRKKRTESTSSSSSSSSSASSSASPSSPPVKGEEDAEKEKLSAAAAGKEEEEEAGKDQVVEGSGDKVQEVAEKEEQEEEKLKVVPAEEAEESKRRFEKLKEGVDFIETEEDAEAVESAVVKIQSTFRGKKIRSKLGQNNKQSDASQSKTQQQALKAADSERAIDQATGKAEEQEEELNEQVAGMQVNDNKLASSALDSSGKGEANAGAMEQEEAQRAATKIQAGFKGYKTRKELEGKLSGSGTNSAGTGGSCEQAEANDPDSAQANS